MTKRLLLTLSCFYSIALFAQQAPPIGVLPTYYNSGFAGEAGAPRISTFSFMTTYGHSGVYQYGNYLSYDNFFKKIRSGVSLTVGQLNQNSGPAYQFRSRVVNAVISPKFSFGGKYTLAPFVRFNLVEGKSDHFYLGTQGLSSYESKSRSGGISSGALFNSSKWYVGFTVGSRQLQNLFYQENNIPASNSNFTFTYWTPSVNWSFQAGYTFQRKPDSKFSFTPQIVFSPFRYRQYFSNTIGNQTIEHKSSDQGVRIDDMNLMFRYKKIIAGVNVQRVKINKNFFQAWKDPDISLGYQTKKFRILLNQNYTRGVYEGKLGLRYIFPRSADNGPVSIQ